jgi:glucose/arabinose dehydrogenase
VLFTVLFLAPAVSPAIPALPYPGIHLEKIRMPQGFRISLYSEDIPGARSMALGAEGTVFVGTRGEGKVYALRDRDGDYRAEEVLTIAEDLRSPNGVAFRDGDLYVAEVGRVLRYGDIESRLYDSPDPVIVNDTFPKDGHHGWKYIAFGPDGKLYVPVGAPCNVCERKDNRYASIMRMNRDGTGLEIFARGIRNTVGFDWHPESGELWFTNNGRDWMGDDVPPDTLHRAAQPGLHFGFPFCHGVRIPDPDFGSPKGCDRFASPAMELGSHVAALGMKFYTGAMFPPEYRGQIFIAEHGSWNRSKPVGYRITRVRLEGNRAKDYRVFAQGWLQGRWAWGRPVDLLLLHDGSMLVSDDRAGAVYRITWNR